MHSGLRLASAVARPLILIAAAAAAWMLATTAWSQSSSSSEAAASSASSSAPSTDVGGSIDGWSLGVSIALFALALGGGYFAIRWLMDKRPHIIPTYQPAEIKVFNSTRVIAKATAAFAVAGLLIVAALCLGFAEGSTWKFLAFLGTDVLVASAAAAAGAVAGFIFGIPRTRDALDRASADGDGGPVGAQRSKAVLLANTNLERISDWLTTLLIGATLVQLRDLPSWLVNVGDTLKSDFTNANVVPFVLVFFFGLAFLGIYLVTRLYLTVTFWQTLEMVGGSDGGGFDLSGERRKLQNSLGADDAAQLEAIKYLDTAGIKPDQAGDPEFSLALARVLLKLLEAGKADDTSRRTENLKAVVGVISKDATTAAILKADLDKGTYTSGNADLDKQLAALLTPPS